MQEYMFGVTKTEPTKKVSKRLGAICREEGGYGFQWLDIPGTRQGWFSGPNRGHPFDVNLMNRVLDRCGKEGIWPIKER
jgi:hypothetical protein